MSCVTDYGRSFESLLQPNSRSGGRMSVVVLSFDRLRLSYLGCFGNDWIETPRLNALAIESICFDQHFGDSFVRNLRPTSWWTGCYTGRPTTAVPNNHDQNPHLNPGETAPLLDLPGALAKAGINSQLYYEIEPELTPVGDDVWPAFTRRNLVPGQDAPDLPETELPFSQLVAEVTLDLQAGRLSLEKPGLIWISSRGVPTPWFPPAEFDDLYFDEFRVDDEADEELIDATETDEEDDDFDGVLYSDQLSLTSELAHRKELAGQDREARLARALYAAYVTYLDRWIGKLVGAFAASPGWEGTTFILVAAGGQQIGERGSLGNESTRLYEELAHAPLIIRRPDSPFAGSRRQSLTQPLDIPATVCELLGVPPEPRWQGVSLCPILRGMTEQVRDAAYFSDGESTFGMRTVEFSYHTESTRSADSAEPSKLDESADETSPQPSRDQAELFTKPADRFDQINLATQFAAAADECHARLEAWLAGNPSSA